MKWYVREWLGEDWGVILDWLEKDFWRKFELRFEFLEGIGYVRVWGRGILCIDVVLRWNKFVMFKEDSVIRVWW